MRKINLKKILPLVGIGAVGVSSAIAATAIAVPNVTKNNKPNVLKLENQVLSYAMNNLTNLDVLNSPIQLANYLDDYGAFDNTNSNSVPSVDVIKTKSVDNEFYVKLEIKSNNDSLIENTDWLKTSIPVTNDIGTINFDNLKKQFLTFNDINIAFDFIYSSTSSLINLITSNTTLNSNQILNASLNISNNFGDDLKTLSFDLTLVLNNCNSNGKTTFVVNLPTSCEIDWTSASQNFDTYFNVDSVGTTITSIKDSAANEKILIIPETYTNNEGNPVTIENIQSLLPETSTTTINTKIIIMPNSIQVIGNNAFSSVQATTGQQSGQCFNNLKWINLSKELANIGNYAFANCTNLQNLPLYSLERLIEIGDAAFYNCTSLTSVYMNDVLQSIGVEMFKGCSNLLNVRLSRSPLITSIPLGFFRACSKLKSVVFPKTITTIGDHVFISCSSLTYLNMPLNLRSLGNQVFNGASSVKNLVFLNNGTVNQIQFGQYAFAFIGKSTNITNIYILGEYKQSSNFSNCFSSASNINVLVESKNVYDIIHDGRTGLDLSRLFIIDPENLPYVKVSHIPEFIEYWQDRVKTTADVNFDRKKLTSFKTASSAVGGVLVNDNWVDVVNIIKTTNNNNEVYRIQFQVTLKNKQYFEINIPLLTPIPLS